jgi:hypothetical protein
VFRNLGNYTSNLLPRKMEQIECSETSAIINQTPGNHPKEDILYSKHGESLKSSRMFFTRSSQTFGQSDVFIKQHVGRDVSLFGMM